MALTINLGLSAVASGVDTITATYTPAPTLVDKKVLFLRTAGANTSTTPTFSPNGLTAYDIVKAGLPLVAGDLDGVVILMYDLANTRWELLNPKTGGGTTLTTDQIDAINNANAPDGSNPFATINDIPTINPTSTFLPYNNGGVLDDSWLSEDADNIILANSKNIKGSASVASISFNGLAGAVSVGLFANVISPFSKGWNYVSSIGFAGGFGTTAYYAFDLVRAYFTHATKIELDSPIIKVTQGTASKLLRLNASKEVVASTLDDSDIATISYVDAKVIDSIADSDTTHAPSRNAVFDALELKATITELQSSVDKYAVATGTDTYLATLSPVPSAYATGNAYWIKIPNSNTVTNPTLNINSLGAKTIVGSNGAAIPVGLLIVNANYCFVYDGTNMVLQGGLMDRRDASHFRKVGTTTYERWYSTNINCTAPTTGAFAKDLLRAVPFIVSKTITLDRIGIEVTGAGTAASVCRLGIYSDTGLVPDALVLDAGTIAADSATFQSITINQTLTPGLYWLAYIHNSTANPSFRINPIAGSLSVLGYTNTLGTGAPGVAVQSTLVYTTLPSTFTSGQSVIAAAQPIISVRLSA